MERCVLLCALAACGRIGFETGAQPVGGGDAGADGAITSGDGAPATAIAYVQALAERYPGMGATDSFTLQAVTAGDAVAFMVACAGSGTPTGVSVTAPGWALLSLAPVTIDAPAQIAAASFGAIAPDTQPVTVSVAWAGTNCNRGKTELADELTNTDPTSAAAAFDAHAEAPGTGNCTTTVTTGHDDDAVWAACYSATMATAVGSGYLPAATDGNGDFAEYAVTTDPAGTAETPTMVNPNGFVIVAASLKPR
ncbi:MAG: hypothetical protein ACM31C_30320 [Acidobacteriota bacterium]